MFTIEVEFDRMMVIELGSVGMIADFLKKELTKAGFDIEREMHAFEYPVNRSIKVRQSSDALPVPGGFQRFIGMLMEGKQTGLPVTTTYNPFYGDVLNTREKRAKSDEQIFREAQERIKREKLEQRESFKRLVMATFTGTARINGVSPNEVLTSYDMLIERGTKHVSAQAKLIGDLRSWREVELARAETERLELIRVAEESQQRQKQQLKPANNKRKPVSFEDE